MKNIVATGWICYRRSGTCSDQVVVFHSWMLVWSFFLTLRWLGRNAVDVDSLAAAAVEEHPVSGVAVDWMWMRVLSQPVTFVLA